MRYSEEGSNDRQKEEATYMHFVNYLEEVEEGVFNLPSMFSLVQEACWLFVVVCA